MNSDHDERHPGGPADPDAGANKGGVAGSPGGPKNAPPRIPGQNIDEGTTGAGRGGNDEQHDQQA